MGEDNDAAAASASRALIIDSGACGSRLPIARSWPAWSSSWPSRELLVGNVNVRPSGGLLYPRRIVGGRPLSIAFVFSHSQWLAADRGT